MKVTNQYDNCELKAGTAVLFLILSLIFFVSSAFLCSFSISVSVSSAIRESEPDIIITHHPADTNNDHLQTSMACQEAIRLFQRQPSVKPVKEFWYTGSAFM